MWFLRGLQCEFSARHLCQSVLIVLICLQLLFCNVNGHARNDERQHHRARRIRSMGADDDSSAASKSCDLVKHFFDSMNVTIYPTVDKNTGKFIYCSL